MNAHAFLAAAERLPYGSLADIVGDGGLVVVAPHPDDESLGCGGLIAEARLAGVDVSLVVISDGVGSHPRSRRYPPDALRDLRETETLAAAKELGLAPEAVRFLRLPDTAVPSNGPIAEEACAHIVSGAADVKASAICVTWQHDPHCDHAASARIVAAAAPHVDARILAYPVWGWTLPAHVDVGAAPSGLRLDIERVLTKKSAAIAAHRSQVTDLVDDDPDGFRLSPAMLARFARPFEIFLEVELAAAS